MLGFSMTVPTDGSEESHHSFTQNFVLIYQTSVESLDVQVCVCMCADRIKSTVHVHVVVHTRTSTVHIING